MLTVYEKGSWRKVTVYDIQLDGMNPLFLIYEDGRWIYKSAACFQPDPPRTAGSYIPEGWEDVDEW